MPIANNPTPSLQRNYLNHYTNTQYQPKIIYISGIYLIENYFLHTSPLSSFSNCRSAKSKTWLRAVALLQTWHLNGLNAVRQHLNARRNNCESQLSSMAENMDHFEALPHLIGVASVVDFERSWGWCTRWQLGDGGVRFPPGPPSDVHLGRLEWRVKWWRNRVKPWKNNGKVEGMEGEINRTDWSSRARCVMGREGWREERAWLGRAFWGEALLGGCWEAKEPAGWRLQMAADAWGWEEGGAWPGVHVVGMVAAPSKLLTTEHRPCHHGELLPTASSHQLPASHPPSLHFPDTPQRFILHRRP